MGSAFPGGLQFHPHGRLGWMVLVGHTALQSSFTYGATVSSGIRDAYSYFQFARDFRAVCGI